MNWPPLHSLSKSGETAKMAILAIFGPLWRPNHESRNLGAPMGGSHNQSDPPCMLIVCNIRCEQMRILIPYGHFSCYLPLLVEGQMTPHLCHVPLLCEYNTNKYSITLIRILNHKQKHVDMKCPNLQNRLIGFEGEPREMKQRGGDKKTHPKIHPFISQN